MVRCLSFHQTYRCGRSGACCTSNWPIPIEADRLARVRAAVATGAIGALGKAREDWLARAPDASGTGLLAATRTGCVFYDTTGEHACRVQTALGHDALPLACRQFPRVSVLDPRGASVVLSLYCPTAARLLDAPGPVTIVEAPEAFPADAEYVGLDARAGWPPILRAGLLMDWPDWWRFERRAVDLIANRSASPELAMARIRKVVDRVRGWRVQAGPLREWIDEAFDAATDPAQLDATKSAAAESTTRHLRFLASHAFANWAIHLGEDLHAWLGSIEEAHALIGSGLSVGEADLRLRHSRSGQWGPG